MSEDLKKKKSEYLLELALEEQLDQDMEMKKYEKLKRQSPLMYSLRSMIRECRNCSKWQTKLRTDPGSLRSIVSLQRALHCFSALVHFQSHR